MKTSLLVFFPLYHTQLCLHSKSPASRLPSLYLTRRSPQLYPSPFLSLFLIRSPSFPSFRPSAVPSQRNAAFLSFISRVRSRKWQENERKNERKGCYCDARTTKRTTGTCETYRHHITAPPPPSPASPAPSSAASAPSPSPYPSAYPSPAYTPSSNSPSAAPSAPFSPYSLPPFPHSPRPHACAGTTSAKPSAPVSSASPARASRAPGLSNRPRAPRLRR